MDNLLPPDCMCTERIGYTPFPTHLAYVYVSGFTYWYAHVVMSMFHGVRFDLTFDILATSFCAYWV